MEDGRGRPWTRPALSSFLGLHRVLGMGKGNRTARRTPPPPPSPAARARSTRPARAPITTNNDRRHTVGRHQQRRGHAGRDGHAGPRDPEAGAGGGLSGYCAGFVRGLPTAFLAASATPRATFL